MTLQSACARKVPHKSGAIARYLLRIGQATGFYDDPHYEAYKCPVCRKWHIGRNYAIAKRTLEGVR